MNDWVNCLRLVAFGQQQPQGQQQQQQQHQQAPTGPTQQAAAPAVNPNSQLLAVAAVTQRQLLKQPAATSNASSLCASSTGSQSSSSSSASSSCPLSSSGASISPSSASLAAASAALQKRNKPDGLPVDVLLQCQPEQSPLAHQQQQQQQQLQLQNKLVSAQSNGGLATGEHAKAPAVMTASQAAAAAASALAKTRQRQPSLLGSCKPQPPTDSPFIQQQQQQQQQRLADANKCATGARQVEPFAGGGQIDTLTPTVRGQLIAAAASLASGGGGERPTAGGKTLAQRHNQQQQVQQQVPAGQAKQQAELAALDEEEENMLYCSIEDNPSEHNYRVKVIETELALRCQLKCYQLTGSTTISQQYEELAQFRTQLNALQGSREQRLAAPGGNQMVTFYQLIIGPQELTLLNDYATARQPAPPTTTAAPKHNQQPQGLWSWPYQCIRRYGFDKGNCFMFEAGRKCTSGPGQFVVQTPKAYNIYQDVVKFVNELRTISGGGGGGGGVVVGAEAACTQAIARQVGQPAAAAAAAAQHTGEAAERQIQAAAITQIPVTWTPNSTATPATPSVTIPNELPPPGDNTRRQFFDALRQLDATQAAPAQPQQQQQQQQPPTPPPPQSGHDLQRPPAIISPIPGTPNNDNERQQVLGGGRAIERNSINSPLEGQPPPPPPPPQQQQRQQRQQQQQRDALAASHDFPLRQTATSAIAAGAPPSNRDKDQWAPPPLAARSESSRAAAVARLESRLQAKCGGGGVCSGREQRQASISPSASGSEETDESGYEQGDESVDSNSQPMSAGGKGSLAHLSGGGGGGSGHPTTMPSPSGPRAPASEPSREAGFRRGTAAESPLAAPANARQQPPRHSAGRATKPAPSLAQLVAAPASAAGGHEDFEASLMRDVYSEITKLHAKFAVTTNGTDEGGSMSSGESHTSTSGTGDSATDENATHEPEEECDSSMESEPVYTNLSAGQPRDAARRVAAVDATGPGRQPLTQVNQQHTHQLRLQQQQQDQQMHSNYHAGHLGNPFRPPHYPSILNPIPEVGEHQVVGVPQRGSRLTGDSSGARAPRAPQMSAAPNSASRQASGAQQRLAEGAGAPDHNSTGDREKQLKEGSPRARLALNREAIKRSQASVGPQQQAHQRQRMADGARQSRGSSAKPSNQHYLINDVQYAKISRNMAPATGVLARGVHQRR